MTRADVPEIARVHVDSWQRSFRTVLSKKYLSGLSTDECQHVHIKDLNQADANWILCVAENDAGEIIGFCKGAPIKKPFEDYDCELVSLYINPDFQSHRVGSRLFFHVVEFLHGRGFKHLLLWVISKTQGVNFYTRLGAKQVTRKYEHLDNSRLVLGMGFRNIGEHLVLWKHDREGQK